MSLILIRVFRALDFFGLRKELVQIKITIAVQRQYTGHMTNRRAYFVSLLVARYFPEIWLTAFVPVDSSVAP